ncbi:hypothetical protein CJ030_MR3G002941 [Morella rubra]|uniref:Uncharacterized protein n=1 Tax=Morella rubra TaxID=262757 RepID=A0A6A1WD09_9ROSI|nr:hypothetical protein CJ030_MR3G002941 [Morella rubra]
MQRRNQIKIQEGLNFKGEMTRAVRACGGGARAEKRQHVQKLVSGGHERGRVAGARERETGGWWLGAAVSNGA